MRLILKISFLIIVFTSSLSDMIAQITWEKLFSARSTDVFRCVKQVDSGNYILAGYTADSTVNDTDAFVVKMKVNGDTAWTFKFNGPLSGKDLFYKVIPTLDGGFAMCGYTTSVTGLSDDVMYMKLNAAGQMQWVKYWGGSGRDRAQDIIQMPNGNFAIVGYTTSIPALYYDAFLILTDSVGDTLSTRLYGGSSYDDANAIQLLSDGGFILGGQSNNGSNGFDQFLIRTDSNGDTLWTRKMGSTFTDNIESIGLLNDGFILAGNTNSPITGDDGYLVRTDTSGNVIWAKTFGGNLPDDFHSVQQTSDGGFVAAGTTSSTGPALPNLWLMKTNSLGDSLWSRTYGGISHDHGYYGIQTLDGGYLVVGHTGSFGFNHEEAIAIKTDSVGIVNKKLTYTCANLLINPTSLTCGAPNTIVQVLIRNFGDTSVASVPVTLQISGALNTTLNQTYNATFVAGDADTVTFSTPINTTSGGTFTFSAYTSNNNDVYPLRNSFSTTLTIEGYASSPVTTGNARCGTGSVTLSATGSPALYWYSASSGGTLLNTGPTYNTSTISATTTYYVQAGLNCPSSRIPVVATINALPVNPVTTDGSRCGPGTVALSASAANNIFWFNSASGGTSVGSGTAFITPSLNATTTFYAETQNTNCVSSRIAAVATINPIPANPVTTSGSRCGTGIITVSASSSDPINWYDAATGGNYLGSGNTYSSPLISSTVTYYAEADNGICISSLRVPATALITTSGVDPVIAAQSHCGPGVVTLNAVAQDSVNWYDMPSGGTLLFVGNSFTTSNLSATTTFYGQTGIGTCLSNMVPVTVTINPQATDPVTTSNERCGPGILILNATSPDPVLWYNSPVGGNQVGVGSSLTTPFISTTKTYYAQSFKGVCLSNRISAVATIFAIPIVNLGTDTVVTSGTSFTIDAGSGMSSYLWSTGETSQSINVSSTDTFCVTVTSVDNCSNSDCIFVDITTSLHENIFNAGLNIYPNPAHDKCTITIPSSLSKTGFTIRSITGAIVRKFETNEHNVDLDVTALSAGIYLMEINSGDYLTFRKLVVE